MSTTTTTTATATPTVAEQLKAMTNDQLESKITELSDQIAKEAQAIKAAEEAVSKKRLLLQKMRGEARTREGNTRLAEATRRAEERIAKAQDAMGDCWCGCGIPHQPGKRFVQGHDARFWGTVNRIRNGKETITENTAEKVKAAIEGEWQKGQYGS